MVVTAAPLKQITDTAQIARAKIQILERTAIIIRPVEASRRVMPQRHATLR